MNKLIKRFITCSFSIFLYLSVNFAHASIISAFGEQLFAPELSTIEFAVLFEAAAYRHDLYYEYGNTEGHIATNPWGSGSTRYCGFCSYPSIYGEFQLNNSDTEELTFRLEINKHGLAGAFRTGAAEINPDGLVHAWYSNKEGLSSLDIKFDLNISHESFSIDTLVNYYREHSQINKLLSHSDTIFVGFEDIYGGGDFDYNDIIFAFHGIYDNKLESTTSKIPEPCSILLFLPLIAIIFKKH